MSSATAANPSLDRLPSEIQISILNFVQRDVASIAFFATVSRNWQALVEQRNFARIKVTPSRLNDLNSMTYRNRHLVKYLWLFLELEEYRSTAYNGVSASDNIHIAATVRDLFSALSEWEPNGNLKLDISIHSPSDIQHGFEHLTFEPDLRAKECRRDQVVEQATMAQAPSETAILRHFDEILVNYPDSRELEDQIETMEGRVLINGTDEDMDQLNSLFDELDNDEWRNLSAPDPIWWEKLAQVPAVTSVLLRQQNRRRWPSMHLETLISSLPNLQEFHNEPWREWNIECEEIVDEGYECFLLSLPTTLKRLVIFENFNQQYSFILDRPEVRTPTLKISEALAEISSDLEMLSASYFVDASYFFAACEPFEIWPNLTSLTITSQLLKPNMSLQKTAQMLERAARVALKMPRLETLEIWNGQRGLAALFRYHVRSSILAWRATWEFNIPDSVIRAWDDVAFRHRHASCVVVRELLDGTMIESHGDAVHHLGHSSRVLRPVSLHQIRTEQRYIIS